MKKLTSMHSKMCSIWQEIGDFPSEFIVIILIIIIIMIIVIMIIIIMIIIIMIIVLVILA